MAVVSPQDLPLGAYYLLQDLLYRAVALTNSSGQVVEAYDTDAYGNTLIFTGPGADGVWFTDDDVQSNYGANEITYCGYRFDSESQLYYVRNRTYNPVLGRWIQRDPIGYAGGINLYEYVASLPPIERDPAGMAPNCQALGKMIDSPTSDLAAAGTCPPWGNPYPALAKITMSVRYKLFGRPKGLCAFVHPTGLARCAHHFNWHAALGFGCAGFQLLLWKQHYSHPCALAKSEIALANRTKRFLAFSLPCPRQKKCCDKRVFHGAHPADITLVVSTPGCTLKAHLTATVTSSGYTGSCK